MNATPRRSLALTAVFLGIAVALCIVESSDVSLASATPTQPVTRTSAVIDQQVIWLETVPGNGSPSIGNDPAVVLAKLAVPTGASSTDSRSSYVYLTLRDTDGALVRGIQSRPVWLVTLTGVGYSPPGTSNSVCACASTYNRPNTMAALDARTGKLIVVVGVEN